MIVTKIKCVILMVIIFVLMGCTTQQPVSTTTSVELDFKDIDAFLKRLQATDIDPNNPAEAIKPRWRKPRKRVAITCREAPARQAIFGANDIPVLLENINRHTDKHWIFTFSEYWLNCHPNDECFKYLDVNNDGITNMIDFAMLAKESEE